MTSHRHKLFGNDLTLYSWQVILNVFHSLSRPSAFPFLFGSVLSETASFDIQRSCVFKSTLENGGLTRGVASLISSFCCCCLFVCLSVVLLMRLEYAPVTCRTRQRSQCAPEELGHFVVLFYSSSPTNRDSRNGVSKLDTKSTGFF